MKQPNTWLWRVAILYMTGVVIAALVFAVRALQYWLARLSIPYTEALQRGLDAGLKPALMVWSPILLFACAALGVVVIVFLIKRRSFALYLVMAATAVVLVGLFYGDEILRDIEGRYYRRSRYVKAYKSGAVPLAIASAAMLLALVGDLLWRLVSERVSARRRADEPAGTDG